MMFAVRLREAMAHHGWTVRECARLCVLGESSVSHLVHSHTSPRLSTAMAVSLASGFTLDALAGDEPLGGPTLEPERFPIPSLRAWTDALDRVCASVGTRAFADALGVSKAWLCSIRKGRDVWLESATRIADAAGEPLHSMALGMPRHRGA